MDWKKDSLRASVHKAYSSIANKPSGKHPVPVGRRFAEEIGYPANLLDAIPASAIDSFTGVSNLSIFSEIKPGDPVLDIGCGAGLDSIIAANRTGPKGRVIGIDFSLSMITRAKNALAKLSLNNLEFHVENAEDIKAFDGSFDVVMINGIFNLNLSRDKIISELFRIVRSGGSVYAAEIILIKPLPVNKVCSLDKWFA